MLAAAHVVVFAGEMTAEVVKKKLAEKAVEAAAHQADKVPKLHAFRLTAEAKYREGETRGYWDGGGLGEEVREEGR